MKLMLGKIADWIHADGEFNTAAEAEGYSIDSRTIGAGELFFAVTGERLDGHAYVGAALANGAVAAVVMVLLAVLSPLVTTTALLAPMLTS